MIDGHASCIDHTFLRLHAYRKSVLIQDQRIIFFLLHTSHAHIYWPQVYIETRPCIKTIFNISVFGLMLYVHGQQLRSP